MLKTHNFGGTRDDEAAGRLAPAGGAHDDQKAVSTTKTVAAKPAEQMQVWLEANVPEVRSKQR